MIGKEGLDTCEVTILEGAPSQTDIVALLGIDIPGFIALS